MGDLLSFFTMRSVILFGSTAFSILFVMLVVGIITPEEVLLILHIQDRDTIIAFNNVIARFQEVSKHILDILSQLLNKLLGWTGVDVDLSKIKIDVDAAGSGAASTAKDATAN